MTVKIGYNLNDGTDSKSSIVFFRYERMEGGLFAPSEFWAAVERTRGVATVRATQAVP